MGKGIGITAIVFFVFFMFISIVLAFEIGGNDLAIAIIVLVEGILFCSTAFLIPGILSLVGKHLGVAAWYYALIPLTIVCILIYTIVIAALFPMSFISNFLEFLGTGIAVSVIFSIVTLCATHEKLH
jgi:hypothetical protein